MRRLGCRGGRCANKIERVLHCPALAKRMERGLVEKAPFRIRP